MNDSDLTLDDQSVVTACDQCRHRLCSFLTSTTNGVGRHQLIVGWYEYSTALRSFSDVPNRIVRLFLQEVGREYDSNRGLAKFSKMTPDLLMRFANRCAYCGAESPRLVEEHLVPMNRESVGLHAWGNVVPACKSCNDIKSGHAWEDHPRLSHAHRARITQYVADYRYDPDVAELKVVLGKLYELVDRQTRALVDFGLVASQPYIAGLHERDDRAIGGSTAVDRQRLLPPWPSPKDNLGGDAMLGSSL